MRIAHINNTSGVGSIIAENQRKEGHNVDVFVFNNIIYNQFGGTKINYRWPISRWNLFKQLEKDYDLWHYHYPYGSLKRSLEKRIRTSNKIYLKHYHGYELRGKYDGDFCLVSTPDLLQYAPNGRWLPNPVDINEIEAILPATRRDSRIRIAHYPYYKNYAAQDVYSEALRTLEKEDRCQIVHILRQSHKEALQTIESCDIVIGKIMPDVGWFGKFELEGMALGKPVISFVSDTLYENYKPPIFRTSKNSFKTDLQSLIDSPDVREQLGKQGPSYVRKVHSIDNAMSIVRESYKLIQSA